MTSWQYHPNIISPIKLWTRCFWSGKPRNDIFRSGFIFSIGFNFFKLILEGCNRPWEDCTKQNPNYRIKSFQGWIFEFSGPAGNAWPDFNCTQARNFVVKKMLKSAKIGSWNIIREWAIWTREFLEKSGGFCNFHACEWNLFGTFLLCSRSHANVVLTPTAA